MIAGVISVIGYVLTIAAYICLYKVVRYHQNQIYSQNHLQNAKTREAYRQRRSAYSSIFVSVVFLACYFPFLPCTILYLTNTSEISFLVAHFASMFLIYLNSSLNPFVYCWRYREIRQSVKSTVKQIFHMNENMSETNTSQISFLVPQVASVFLICLNSSLNPIVYCWRYREIREIVKSTVKELFHMNENTS